MKSDATLRDVIKRIGPCELHAVAPKDPFETLCKSIASQQLSIKAAATIFRRFEDLFPPDRKPTPERVMTLGDDEIRACGFSRPKVSFIKDLAGRVIDRIIRIEEEMTGGRPEPMVRQYSMAKADAATPVSAGEIEIRAQVRLAAAIK